MFRKSLSKDSLQFTLNVLPLQNLVMELDECNEESLLGGSFTGQDILRPKLNSSAVPTKTSGSYYGIRSIPTLM